MNKRFLIIAAVMVLGGGLAVFLVFNHLNSDIETAAPSDKQLVDYAAKHGVKLEPIPTEQKVTAIKPIPASQVVRLAIGSLGISDNSLNQEVGDLVLTELGSVTNLALVDRQSLNTALRESEMSLGGLIRAQSAVRVGKLLRADWFLLGTAAAVNGTNYVVARIVDARTGVIRDAAVFSGDKSTMLLAKDVAAFARQARDAATKPTPKTYLAIGTFQDLSLDNRQVAFGGQLRTFLNSQFQGAGNVTVLERESVETLLQEVRLDIAGLTEESGSNPPAAMQSAFWLVDGFYQSFEKSGTEVEVMLRVHRIFGRAAIDTLRGSPDDMILRRVKQSIDTVLSQALPYVMAPTRRSEISEQFASAEALTRKIQGSQSWGESDIYWNYPQIQVAPLRSDLEDAMKAYQTILLLDSRNNEAKWRLACCLRISFLNRRQEALSLFQEIAESPLADRWSAKAMAELGAYYKNSDPQQAVKWYQRAAERSKRDDTMDMFGHLASVDYVKAANEILAGPSTMDQQHSAEKNSIDKDMVAAARSMETSGIDGGAFLTAEIRFKDAIQHLGNTASERAEAMNKSLPSLRKQFPIVGPLLLTIALTFQADTNSPVIAELEQSANEFAEHPEKNLRPGDYLQRLCYDDYNWCMEHKLFGLAARLIQIRARVEKQSAQIMPHLPTAAGFFLIGNSPYMIGRVGPDDYTKLAYAFMALERWQDALEALKRLPEFPFALDPRGPWGASNVIIPGELIAKCSEKLGLPLKNSRPLFTFGEPLLNKQTFRAYIPDGDVLWIVLGNSIWQSDLEGAHLKELKLGIPPEVCITFICNGKSRLWVGTCSAGIFEYNKDTRECRNITVKEGLWSDNISALREHGDTLWIAYRSEISHWSGEIGEFDIQTRAAVTFTPPLHPDPLDPTRPPDSQFPDDPPKDLIESFHATADDLLLTSSAYKNVYLYHLHDRRWERPKLKARCATADSKRFILSPDGTSLLMRNGETKEFEILGKIAGLSTSEITTLNLDGNNLWVGGLGFIAVVDLDKHTVTKSAYIHTSKVDHIDIASGYLWAQFNNCLYRVPLSEIR